MNIYISKTEMEKAYAKNCPLEASLKRLYPNSKIEIKAAHPQTTGVVKVDNSVFTYRYHDWNYSIHRNLQKNGMFHNVLLTPITPHYL